MNQRRLCLLHEISPRAGRSGGDVDHMVTKENMLNAKMTPPLPVAPSLRDVLKAGVDLPATQAHKVLLHCALDAACVPDSLRDPRVTTQIAELDYQTVAIVINWLRAANPRGL
jgi:hypothetical protein